MALESPPCLLVCLCIFSFDPLFCYCPVSIVLDGYLRPWNIKERKRNIIIYLKISAFVE